MNYNDLCYYAKHNLVAFPKLASNNQNPPHLNFISRKVQYIIETPCPPGKYKLLIFSCPPRHGKTELISKHLPCWFLGKYPDKRVIMSSYASDLATDNSSMARDLFEEWGPILWNVHKSEQTFKKNEWKTNKGGGCRAVGIGGGITGFGGDLFLIDDYLKDRQEAYSQLIRDGIYNWFSWAAMSRLHPGATMIIMATRWHDDDLIGRTLKTQDENPLFDITYINLPALKVEGHADPLGREDGQSLWELRYSAELLNNIKKSPSVGSIVFDALYQGNPTSEEGALFKSENFRYYNFDPKKDIFTCYVKDREPLIIRGSELTRCTYVDPAIELKTYNDPTGIAVWAYSSKYKIWLLLDIIIDRIDINDLNDTIINLSIQNRSKKAGLENEKLGKAAVKLSAGRDRGIAFFEVPTGGIDKYARASTMAIYIGNERVFFPQHNNYLNEYLRQLTKFPNADHDEAVDITSMAANMERKRSIAQIMADAAKQ
jgi:predicted phage terminase large subunit-like protein